MSTATTTPAPTPKLAHFLSLFNSLAVQTAAGLATVTADLEAGQKTQAISDAITGTATALASVNPLWGPDIAAANEAAQLGIALISGFIALFHHPKPAPAS